MSSNLQYHFKSQSFDIRKIFNEFKKPFYSNLFYKNKDGLLLDADYVTFQFDKWECNPLQFCEDFYQNQYLYPIILLANSLSSMFDFTEDNVLNRLIVAPKSNTIMKILSNVKE